MAISRIYFFVELPTDGPNDGRIDIAISDIENGKISGYELAYDHVSTELPDGSLVEEDT